MKFSPENYVPQAVPSFVRKQAWTIWAISLSFIALWVFLILLAPVAESAGWQALSAPVYNFFSYICHQMPERSLRIGSEPFAVCSRCLGVYFGLLCGFLFYPVFKEIDEIEPPRRAWLFLALIPMGIDWSLGAFGIWQNTHFTRFATGVILGVACAIFIVPALVELFRLMSRRK